MLKLVGVRVWVGVGFWEGFVILGGFFCIYMYFSFGIFILVKSRVCIGLGGV